MPEEHYVWLERGQLLSFEEVARLARIFSDLGVTKVRLTGGEPLVRRNLGALIRQLASDRRIEDLALTTNGILLAEQAGMLRESGLHRITVSLDTLRPDRFQAISKRDGLSQVLSGIEAAGAAGFRNLKLDAVVIRGTNDDELSDLIEYGRQHRAEVRFIEYMDVGGATRWSRNLVVSRAEMLQTLAERYGPIEPLREVSCAPAERFVLPDGTLFGIIASTTAPFCQSCDRSRITADGVWYTCLYAKGGLDLRRLLRQGSTDAEIGLALASQWRQRTDRGAEERLGISGRGPLVSAAALQADPHLEMHTRGG
jgi:cyclic pyranopterin phosphate synthase